MYVAYGEEPLQQFESADGIRLAAREQGYASRTVFTVAGARFDWSAVMAAVGARSLFGDKTLVELRIPTGKPGRDGSSALQQLAQAIVQSQDAIVLLSLGARLDRAARNSAWFKGLDAAAIMIPCDPVERRSLPEWIARRLATRGLRVAPGDEGRRALAFFADRVEGNLLAAHQEIEKLSLLHPAVPDTMVELSFDDVETAVMDVARYDVFRLVEVVLAGQVGRAERMLDGLAGEGQATVLVHWVLSEEIRTMARVRAALDAGHPLPLALKENRVWGPREQAYARIVPRLTRESTDRLLRMASDCDGLVKGLSMPGWPSDPWSGLRGLMLSLLDVAAQRPGAGHALLHA